MRCQKCGNENPATNKYCGQCGSQLSVTSTLQDTSEPSGPILTSFREDVERQQSNLRDMQEQSGGAEAATPTTPLSRLATAPADFGPPSAVVAVPVEPVAEPERPAAKQWFSPPKSTRTSGPQITGPSFLGLSDPDTPRNDVSYLYEDDPPSGHARFWIAALIAIAFAGFIYYEWHHNPDLQAHAQDWVNRAWGRKAAEQSQQLPPAPAGAAPPTTPASPSAAKPIQSPATEQTTPAAEAPPASSSIAPDSAKESAEKTQASQTTTQGASPSADVAVPEEQSAADTPVKAVEAKSQKPTAVVTDRPQAPDKALVEKADQYLYGRGVAKNCDQALVYLRSAADAGNAAARSKLGGLYATGNCVPLDRARAYHWFSLARQSGDHNVWVDRNMTMLWSSMTPQERSRVGR